MRIFFQNLLASLARKIIKKYNPIIIGITGSIGKTSAKEAIFKVVSQKYQSRKSEKNFNNEIGLPLAIIGTADAPGKDPFKWLVIILQALLLIAFKQRYPKVLVLEMGVDRTGDMDHLLSIAKPKLAVITNIGTSHYEFFKGTAAIAEEKGKIAKFLTIEDHLIVNCDNESALQQLKKTKAKTLTYGINNPADIKLLDVQESLDGNITTTFTVLAPSRKYQTAVKVAGGTHLSALAAACAVGEALNIETDLITKGLKEYKPAPGRLKVFAGIKHTLIIDDSYNASPDSTKTALELLKKVPCSYKIAVLGDMLELGSISDESHREIGKIVAGLGINKLVTVGESGKIIAEGAKTAGMDKEHIISFDDSEQAKKSIQESLQPESLILIKGSQGMRMEKITKEIMAEPMRATELLCRQYGKWLK